MKFFGFLASSIYVRSNVVKFLAPLAAIRSQHSHFRGQMRCAAHLGLAITCVAVQAAQIPFQPSRHIETAVSSSTLEQSWDLDALPDPDSTAHLVFDTVSSLLQHWPNTRYRNGVAGHVLSSYRSSRRPYRP